MKKLQIIGAMVILATPLSGCLDDYLTTTPPTILTDEQVWGSPVLIEGVLANYYSRLPDFMSFATATGDVPNNFVHFDEGIFSGNTFSGDPGANQILEYPYNIAVGTGNNTVWHTDYELIRDINLAIENITDVVSAQLTPAIKQGYIAELRFQRAWVYFDLVKRVGGVPILDQQQIYDFSGDPSPYQQPRDTEAAVYDFIASEIDAIVPLIGNAGSISRGNKYAALALKSRAMLYAGSIARHNSELPSPITLAGGVVGIPGSQAAAYYQKSLDASKAILNSGVYSLYMANPNPQENFWEALTKKAGNPETIWVRDYSVSGGINHIFTLSIIPPSQRMDAFGGNQGSTISPSLQLVETYDYLDGSAGTLRGVGNGTAAGQANWIFYDQPEDIFAGKDGRLYGTVVYPGTTVRGGEVEIQAGVYVWNSGTGRYDKVEGAQNSNYTDGGVLTGQDGPIGIQSHVSTTGFYLRKFLDPAPAAATAATRSDVPWVRFRLGEVYLNAAEAAFELGLSAEALGYMNTLRERAGFPANSLTTLTRNKIRSERWAELAFEDHRLWDLKRWRIAHVLWDGQLNSPTAHVQSLWAYRVVHPGSPRDGKYVFDRFPSQRQTRARYFREGNYYSEIPAAALNNNPQLIENPFH